MQVPFAIDKAVGVVLSVLTYSWGPDVGVKALALLRSKYCE